MMGLKHLITCRCTLPTYKRHKNPPDHQFVVFSIINDDGTVKPKFAQCNNCTAIHKVTEINRSEIMPGREDMGSIISIDDIKVSLPEKLVGVLEANDADLASWEYAQFIFENKRWGEFVVLTTDEEGGVRQGKYVTILGETMLKIESFEREEVTK
jgi:hypothetical protein